LWVGPPREYPEEDSSQPGLTFSAAGLQCDPYFRDWDTIGVLHVFGAEIVANSNYELDAIPAICTNRTDLIVNSGTPLTVSTGRWGDAIAPFEGEFSPAQPDFNDVAAIVQKFTSVPGAPNKVLAQLQPNTVFPGRSVDFKDIASDVNAFIGLAYASLFVGPCTCPSTVTCGMIECSSDALCPGACAWTASAPMRAVGVHHRRPRATAADQAPKHRHRRTPYPRREKRAPPSEKVRRPFDCRP